LLAPGSLHSATVKNAQDETGTTGTTEAGERLLHTSTAAAAFAALLVLSGCSSVSDSLWPSFTGDEPSGERVAIESSAAERNPAPTLSPAAPPPLGTSDFSPPQVSGGQPTGTFVGQKVGQLRGELQQLQGRLSRQNQTLQQIRDQLNQNAQRYHGTVAAITARLQLGTTPGNPVLTSQWNAAQSELDRVSQDIAAMNTLSNDVAANSSLAAYVLESARASYALAGAIDEDHRQLAILEDETNRTVVLVDRLLSELNEDVARQTSYVANERSNLTTISDWIRNGEVYGPSLLARAYAGGTVAGASGGSPYASTTTPRTGFSTAGRRPLVVIRFDRPDVQYQQALYAAISQALNQRPEAQFDVVAVAPSRGSAGEIATEQSRSKKFANQVVRSLTEMGLPASRVNLAATTQSGVGSNEVHIFVR
jgi:hypothetical protein